MNSMDVSQPRQGATAGLFDTVAQKRVEWGAMKIYTLRQEQLVNRPRSEVFSFFARPENLQVITPPWLGFVLLTPSPVRMREGAVIDYAMRALGKSMRWTSIITEYDPPNHFVDQQLVGPYSFWYHTHTFTEARRGTLIVDEVRYIVPFGPLGRLAHALYVESALDKIFDYRKSVIEKAFAVT
jgi:hypothetical protein